MTIQTQAAAPTHALARRPAIPRHTLLLAGLGLGIGAGLLLHAWADHAVVAWLQTNVAQVIGQLFLRMLFMIVVPLIFSALVLGVFELGKSQGLGRVASRTIVFTLLASTLSVLVGVGLVNILKPGASYRAEHSAISTTSSASAVQAVTQQAAQATSFAQTVVELLPRNPIATAARALDGEMIPLMFFALIFGVAIALSLGRLAGPDPLIIELFQQILTASMRVVDFAMKLAPIGVFCIVFGTVLKHGSGILASLAWYVSTVVLGLLVQQFVVYSAFLKVFTSWNPWVFFRGCREVLLYAFSTASSNATLPLTLETAELRLGLPRTISRFVLTVGSTANQNGTALFEGVTVLFLAQVYGIELSLGQQVMVVFTSILAGVGTAGVPGGSLPMVAVLMQTVGVPAEGLGLVLGVDRFLDMCRTALNVSGDLVITALVSGRSSGAPSALTGAPLSA